MALKLLRHEQSPWLRDLPISWPTTKGQFGWSLLPTATHHDETAPHSANHKGGATFGAGKKSTEPFPSWLPLGFDTEPLAADGMEPARFIRMSYPSYFVYQQWMSASRHFQQHQWAPHLYNLFQPIRRKDLLPNSSQKRDLQLPISSEQSPQSFIPLHLWSA